MAHHSNITNGSFGSYENRSAIRSYDSVTKWLLAFIVTAQLVFGWIEQRSFVGCIQKLEVNGRSISIISEAVGGTNVDNFPHACTSKPCGPLAQCVPNLDSYESRSSKTSFNFTDVSDNRPSISANDKNPLDSMATSSTLTTVGSVTGAQTPSPPPAAASVALNSIRASASVQTNLPEVHNTTKTTMANELRKYNAEVVATLSLSNSKSAVVQLSDPHTKSHKMVAKDHIDNKRNNNEHDNFSTTSNGNDGSLKEDADDANAYYYYDDDYEYKNDDLSSSSSSDSVVNIRTMPPPSSTTSTTTTTIPTTSTTTTTTTTTIPTTVSTTTERLTVKPFGYLYG